MAISKVIYSRENFYMLKQGYNKHNFELFKWLKSEFPKVSWKIWPFQLIIIVNEVIPAYVRYAAYHAEKSYSKLGFRLKMTRIFAMGQKNENWFLKLYHQNWFISKNFFLVHLKST